MQQKKKGRGLAVCLALCVTLLCGGTFVSHAVTPVCGGDHNWCTVREAGRIRLTNWEVFRVANVYFKKAWFSDAVLQRCECRAEQVIRVGEPYQVQVWID